MGNVWIFIIAVVIAVIIGMKTKVNMGIAALAMAFLIGYFCLNLTASKVLSNGFPIAVFYNFFIVATFFGFANQNGTIQALAKNILYTFRNATWMGPFVLFLVTAIVSICGSGGSAALVTSGLCFGVGLAMGLHPGLCSIAIWTGMSAPMLFPWTSTGGTNMGTCVSNGIEAEVATKIGYASGAITFVFLFIEFIVVALILKGFKKQENAAEIQKPEAYTAEQKRTLTIIFICLALVILPSLLNILFPGTIFKKISSFLSVQFVWTIGGFALCIAKCGDFKEVFSKRVGWNTIIMIAGMGTLFGLSKDMGVVDALSGLLNSVSSGLIVPLLTFCSGLMSFFVNGAIVGTMFIPLATTLVAASGASLPIIVTCITAGGGVTAVSPISSGGAAALSGCNNEEARQTAMKWQFAMAFINAVVFSLYMALLSKIF